MLACSITSRNALEGSGFGQFIESLRRQNLEYFELIMDAARVERASLESILRIARQEYVPKRADPRYEPLVAPPRAKKIGGTASNVKDTLRNLPWVPPQQLAIPMKRGHRLLSSCLLIGVKASRSTFRDRVAAIEKTWANVGQIPTGVVIKYFVGDLHEGATYESGSGDDIATLASEASIDDKSRIAVLSGIDDQEYPPIEKDIAVLKHLMRIVFKRESEPGGRTSNSFRWILLVEDDTYLNMRALMDFIEDKSPFVLQYIGHRKISEGTQKPYCMAGPGFLFSKPTLKALAGNLNQCKAKALQEDSSLVGDAIIGKCVQQKTGLGCWEDDRYRGDVFAENFEGFEDFTTDSTLLKTVSIHPLATLSLMARQHERVLKLADMRG